MERLQTVSAILEAIGALPEPARQRLVNEMRQQGYLERARPPAATEPLPKVASEYAVQFTQEPDGMLCVVLVDWVGCKAFGRDRLEAVRNLTLLIGAQAANSDLLFLRSPASPDEDSNRALEPDDRNYQGAIAYLEAYQRRLAVASPEA